jgi:hypothetical protein
MKEKKRLFGCNCTARLSRKKTIIVSAALLFLRVSAFSARETAIGDFFGSGSAGLDILYSLFSPTFEA